MRIIKPLRLAAMHRPFQKDGRDWLALTAIGMTTLRGERILLPDPELWETVAQALGSDGVLDASMPKSQPEFLATGYAYTRHQDDKTQAAVSVQVGRRRKALAVFGDRFWIDGRPSPPQAFDAMPIDWQHAYGGPDHEENPVGIGRSEEVVNGVRARRLPNVEHPDHLLRRPDQVVAPAGLGAIEVQRPSRMQRLGREYDDHWKDHLFPGFSRDMDWRYFNVASPDQWLGDGDGELAGAPFEIRNMHPEDAVIRGTLPDWRACGFIVRGVEPPIGSEAMPEAKHFEQLPMQLTTAWFFPHLDRLALVFHGAVPVTENDAEDVSHMMIALEDPRAAPRDPGHYWQVLYSRCDPEGAPFVVLDDTVLLPEECIGPWLDTGGEDEELPDAMARNMRSRAEHARERLSQAYRATGGDFSRYQMPADPAPATPTLKDLPAFIEKTQALVAAQKERLTAARSKMEVLAKENAPMSRKAGMDTSLFFEKFDQAVVKGPPKTDTRKLFDGITGVAAAVGLPPMAQDKQDELRRVTEHGRQSLTAAYRRMAHHQSAADPMSGAAAAHAREEAQRILAGDRDFSDKDFTGADFSGMDLRGTRWHRTLLEGADFSGCTLDDSDFNEAVLVRARLHRASLRRVVFYGCNLSLASLEDALFEGATLRQMQIEKLQARRCDFSGAVLEEIQGFTLHIEQCRFGRARITALHLLEASVLRQAHFDDAVFERSSLMETQLHDVGFVRAVMTHCAWVAMPTVERVDLSESHLLKTCFIGGTVLQGALFRNATLKDCCLREVPCDGADFSGAQILNSDFGSTSLRRANFEGADAPGVMFMRADFTEACLIDADLSGAVLRKAILVAADLRRANLFRADLSECLVDEHTLFDGAHAVQAVTTPKRKSGAAA